MAKSTKQTDAANFGQGTARDVGGPPGARSYAPVDQVHTYREYVGLGALQVRSVRSQPTMGDDLIRASRTLSVPQAQHGLIWEQRGGTSRKQDFPDGTGHGALRSPSPSGRIKATMQYGLGPNYARPGPGGHDPADTDQPTDYLRRPEGLDRYVGAKDVLQPSEYGSGFPVTHRLSQFPTMGDDLESGLGGLHLGTRDKGAGTPRSNRSLGQSA